MPAGLKQVRIEGFRHLKATALSFSPDLNVIYGANAAGKSSLLEALYFLARAKSFLTPRLQRVVPTDGSAALVTGRINDSQGLHQLGVQFTAGKTRVRLNGEDIVSLSDFARLLPIQVLNTEAQRLLTDGPSERRRFINWGVFHVEPQYRDLWRRYQRGLKQRNTALRLGNAALAAAWEEELAASGEAVSAARDRFLQGLMQAWQQILQAWMPHLVFDWRYRSGWPKEATLLSTFQKNRSTEVGQGFTLYGPHRADLILLVDDHPVAQRLSRGQQKIVVVALRLALLGLWQQDGMSRPILLLDDLAAELDAHHRGLVMERLRGLAVQTFVTTIELDRIPCAESAWWFHVEQGGIVADERNQR